MRSNNSYSNLAAWLAFSFSNFALIDLYLKGNGIWVLIGINLCITFICMTDGIERLIKSIYLDYCPRNFIDVALYSVAVAYFASSLYGFFQFLNILPIADKSIFLLPFIAVLFIFAGASIGLINSNKNNIFK